MLSELSVSLPVFLFVCLMVGLGGFVDSAAGGGGLITLPALAVTELPMHSIIAANKFSASCGSTCASFMFLRKGALHWQVAVTAAATSFLGSALASQLVLLLSDAVLKTILLVIIPLAALVILTRRKDREEDRSGEFSMAKKLTIAALIGLLIGFYDGLIGPGTGTFAIIAFSTLLKFDLRKASGNAKLLNLASNYASTVTFLFAGAVPVLLAIPLGICNICGSLLGSHFALSKGAKFIRPMMLVVMALLLVKLAVDVVF